MNPRLEWPLLAVLAASGCHTGDFGDCDPDVINALPTSVSTTSLEDGFVVVEDTRVPASEPGAAVLACAEKPEGAPACLAVNEEHDLSGWYLVPQQVRSDLADAWGPPPNGTDWAHSEECGPMELDGMCCWHMRFPIVGYPIAR